MQIPKSRVYVQTDETGRVLRLEGEYSLPTDLAGWTKIDEGYGDTFLLSRRAIISISRSTTARFCAISS